MDKELFLEDLLEDEEAQVKLSVARHIIDIYLASREGLKKLGILRSERRLSGDYAEWLVAQFLNLSLVENPVEKGVDAVDAKGVTYQIKSRRCTDLNITHPSDWRTSFNFRNIDDEFDYMIGVLFDHSLNVMAIIKVTYEAVKEMGNQTKKLFTCLGTEKMKAMTVLSVCIG